MNPKSSIHKKNQKKIKKQVEIFKILHKMFIRKIQKRREKMSQNQQFKVLINHSNHPSEKWTEEQRKGWDKIIDLPFPEIDPEMDKDQVETLALENFKKIKEIAVKETAKNRKAVIHVMLQGEFSYCYLLYNKIKDLFPVVLPTTKREVVEKEDGTKISTFKFRRWRTL